MELSEDIKRAFSRLRLPSHRSTEDAYEALKCLATDERIDLVAGYEGQSLEELQASFQLLPLGTRLALDTARAIRLHDDGERDFYHVEVLPFALDVVQAAVAHRDARQRTEAGSVFDAEVARIWRERFELVPEPHPDTPTVLPKDYELVGTFEVAGELADVDQATHMAAIRVLGNDGRQLPNVSIHYVFNKDARFVVGSKLNLDFEVGIPPSAKRSKYRRFEMGPLRQLVESTPGTLMVHCSADQVVFNDDDGEPNAVAALRDVEADVS